MLSRLIGKVSGTVQILQCNSQLYWAKEKTLVIGLAGSGSLQLQKDLRRVKDIFAGGLVLFFSVRPLADLSPIDKRVAQGLINLEPRVILAPC